MKVIFSVVAGFAMILSVSSMAYSADGPYVSGNFGLAIPNDSEVTDSSLPAGINYDVESKNGLAFGVAAGYGFSNIRVEVELGYSKNDLDKVNILGQSFDLTGDISSLTLFLNGYYDFKNSSSFTPYLGCGIGMAKVEVNDDGLDVDDNDTVFAYKFAVGLGYAVTEKVSLDVKYSYFGTSDLEFDTATVEYSGHIISAGIRVTF